MIDEIIRAMNLEERYYEVQRIQTKHRLDLIKNWGIKPGDRVLEIGCGQGDMTAALAYIVGEKGYVKAIDIASEDYGRPETLGQARKRLMSGSLSKQLDIMLNTDFLSEDIDFQENSFDVIVLSMCSWYFEDDLQLSKVLQKARKFAKKLCFAEWDVRPTMPAQLAHYQAVMIQAMCESFNKNSEANIRTLLYPEQLVALIQNSGWSILSTSVLDTEKMQDGHWEVQAALSLQDEIDKGYHEIPYKTKQLILQQIQNLRTVNRNEIHPLNLFAIVAD